MARITFSTMYNTTMVNLQRNANTLNSLQEKIASEQMINRPSDDPVGFTNALNYRNILNSIKQQKINMDDGGTYMTALEISHDSMNTLFGRCQELAVQAAQDTQNHQQRLFTNMEVRQRLEELVSIAQTKHKDGYIFSGKWTDQPPYEIKNGNADYRKAPNSIDIDPAYDPTDPTSLRFGTSPVTIQLYDTDFIDQNIKPQPDNPMVQRIIPGSIQLNGLIEKPLKDETLDENHPNYEKYDYEVDYASGTITLISDKAKAAFYDETTGDIKDQLPSLGFEYIYRNSIDMSGEIYREIDSGITMKINSNPDDLFGKGGADDTDAFKEIIALMQGLWHNEQGQINKSIDTINTARERNLEQQAVEGARLNRLSVVYDRNAESKINYTEAQTEIEGVDLADVYSKFIMADSIYSASLQASANLMRPSLMDYI